MTFYVVDNIEGSASGCVAVASKREARRLAKENDGHIRRVTIGRVTKRLVLALYNQEGYAQSQEDVL